MASFAFGHEDRSKLFNVFEIVRQETVTGQRCVIISGHQAQRLPNTICTGMIVEIVIQI